MSLTGTTCVGGLKRSCRTALSIGMPCTSRRQRGPLRTALSSGPSPRRGVALRLGIDRPSRQVVLESTDRRLHIFNEGQRHLLDAPPSTPGLGLPGSSVRKHSHSFRRRGRTRFAWTPPIWLGRCGFHSNRESSMRPSEPAALLGIRLTTYATGNDRHRLCPRRSQLTDSLGQPRTG